MKKPSPNTKRDGIIVKLSHADRGGRDFYLLMPASTDTNKLLAMLNSAAALEWEFDGAKDYLVNKDKPKVNISLAEHKEILSVRQHLDRQADRRNAAALPANKPTATSN